MADQKRITLRQGEADPKVIRLRELPVADVVSTTIYLTQGQANAKDILLRSPASAPAAGVDIREGSAPLSAVAAVTAGGLKIAEACAPVVAVALITAGGQKRAESGASLNATATITAAGEKASESEVDELGGTLVRRRRGRLLWEREQELERLRDQAIAAIRQEEIALSSGPPRKPLAKAIKRGAARLELRQPFDYEGAQRLAEMVALAQQINTMLALIRAQQDEEEEELLLLAA